MSAKNTPMRKPGAREMRGLSAICSEMDAAAQDMRTYRSTDERKRAEDILSGLRWLDAAIAKATGSQSIEVREQGR